MRKLQPTTQFRKDYKRIKNNPKKVKNVQILTSISKNDESLFSEILKRNLVTIDRIRDKLTFYTCAK